MHHVDPEGDGDDAANELGDDAEGLASQGRKRPAVQLPPLLPPRREKLGEKSVVDLVERFDIEPLSDFTAK